MPTPVIVNVFLENSKEPEAQVFKSFLSNIPVPDPTETSVDNLPLERIAYGPPAQIGQS